VLGSADTVTCHSSEHKKTSTCQQVIANSGSTPSVHTFNTHATHTMRPARTPLTVVLTTRVSLHPRNPYLAQEKGEGGEVHLDYGSPILPTREGTVLQVSTTVQNGW